jgi:hypothetical protein
MKERTKVHKFFEYANFLREKIIDPAKSIASINTTYSPPGLDFPE